MSELLKALAAHVRKTQNADLHVVMSQNMSEDEPMLSAAEPRQGKAELVDPRGSIDGVGVGDPAQGKLSYFMDGIERRHVPLFFAMVPIVYGYVAAAIRVRDESRLMRKHAHVSREALYFPYSIVDPEQFGGPGLCTENTETDETPLEEHPIMLKEAAKVAISKARGRIEKKLTLEWLLENVNKEDWLLVDGSLGGTLGGDFQKYDAPNILGLIKSHQTQYFPMEEQRKILGLKAGCRSGIFKPLGREHQAPVYSWYLRMRPNDGQDIYFGLIRIEAAANDRTIEMADEISRWLLAERCPLSLPDSRWDKMLYPIRDCEQYMKSLAPTNAVLQASMTGLGS